MRALMTSPKSIAVTMACLYGHLKGRTGQHKLPSLLVLSF